MILKFQQFLANQTILLLGLQQVSKYLQSPTMIFHDEYDGASIVARTMSSLHLVLLAKTPYLPSGEYLQRPRSFILIAKTPDELIPILRTSSIWNGRQRVLVILEQGVIFNWIEQFWRWTRAVNIVVMTLIQNPQFYTWFPYKENECSKVVTITKLDNINLYPEKINPQLNNCPLIAITDPIPPMVINNERGVEPRLLNNVAQKLGLAIVYKRLPPGQFLWNFLNGTQPVDGLKKLWNNDADIIFRQLMKRVYVTPFAEFMPDHTEDKTVWFVPAPRPASQFTAIYRAFSLKIWTFVLGSILVTYLTFGIFAYLKNLRFRSAFIHTVAISLNLPITPPRSRIVLLFVVVAYFYSMHITTAYQSSLMIFLSDVTREKPIETWADLAQSELIFDVHSGYKPQLDILAERDVSTASILSSDKMAIQFASLDLPAVANPGLRALIGPNIAYGAKLREDAYYDRFGYPLVKILKKPITVESYTFYLSKGHPLYTVMYRYFQYSIEAGLPEYYLEDENKPRRLTYRQLRPFTIDNVIGPFFLYIVLILLCVTALLTELVISLCHKSKSNFPERKPRTFTNDN